MSEYRSALVLGMYALCDLECLMAGPMYQKDSTYGDHDAIYFGLLWITNIVPGGASGAWL